MNVTAKELKATKKTIDRLASLFLPEKKLTQIVLWSVIPSVLLLLSVGLSFINRSPITLYIPVVAITTLCLSIYYRTIGFYISFVGLLFFALIFYRAIPFDQRLWQMEILFSFAIDSFIILLAIEEVEALLGQLETKSLENQERVHSISHEQQETEKKWDEERKAFEAEIERWKTEAEQRRIDKQNDEKRFVLMHSELEMLTSQKEELISDAFEARSSASERLRRLEEQIQETERLAATLLLRLLMLSSCAKKHGSRDSTSSSAPNLKRSRRPSHKRAKISSKLKGRSLLMQ
ncbi:MAG: hypothetical protein KR126chlam2_00955 [Chlamydiae bacterium]|nr:hypothetical protein [Chlamydiota bacterium]